MKQKTHKSAAKRIKKKTKSGFLARSMSSQHLNTGKSKRSRRKSRSMRVLSDADNKRLSRLVPYK